MRVFVAIETDEAVRKRLAAIQEALRAGCPGIRWIPVEQVHLTVKFLGEVADDDVARVCEAVRSVADETSPFDLELSGCGCFPPRGPVRIVWVGTQEPTGRLLDFVAGVESALEPLGFPRVRRPFGAHLTIGRVREDRSGGAVRVAVTGHDFQPIAQPVESVTVMQSVLSPKGPRYTPISRPAFGRKR